MSLTFKLLLTSHVLLGTLGVVALYAVWMGLLKQKISLKFLRFSSLWGFILLVLSWVTGGYYYSLYYGKTVKPAILAGPYPWGHGVFMEAKEHAFLLLPVLALAITVLLYSAGDRVESDAALKKQLAFLSGVTAVIGIVIALSGVVISGAVR